MKWYKYLSILLIVPVIVAALITGSAAIDNDSIYFNQSIYSARAVFNSNNFQTLYKNIYTISQNGDPATKNIYSTTNTSSLTSGFDIGLQFYTQEMQNYRDYYMSAIELNLSLFFWTNGDYASVVPDMDAAACRNLIIRYTPVDAEYQTLTIEPYSYQVLTDLNYTIDNHAACKVDLKAIYYVNQSTAIPYNSSQYIYNNNMIEINFSFEDDQVSALSGFAVDFNNSYIDVTYISDLSDQMQDLIAGQMAVETWLQQPIDTSIAYETAETYNDEYAVVSGLVPSLADQAAAALADIPFTKYASAFQAWGFITNGFVSDVDFLNDILRFWLALAIFSILFGSVSVVVSYRRDRASEARSEAKAQASQAFWRSEHDRMLSVREGHQDKNKSYDTDEFFAAALKRSYGSDDYPEV